MSVYIGQNLALFVETVRALVGLALQAAQAVRKSELFNPFRTNFPFEIPEKV